MNQSIKQRKRLRTTTIKLAPHEQAMTEIMETKVSGFWFGVLIGIWAIAWVLFIYWGVS